MAAPQVDLTFHCRSSSLTFSYLELSLLVWSERLPLWRVKELVAVDVMQELALQRYIDPERERQREIRG